MPEYSSQRVPKYICCKANIATNERDKQGMPCYFTASAGYVRGLPQIYKNIILSFSLFMLICTKAIAFWYKYACRLFCNWFLIDILAAAL